MKQADQIIQKEMSGRSVDCERGCAWCCHQLVVLTHWQDAENILAAARERMTAEEFVEFELRVREQAADIEKLGHERAETRSWPCPLLRENECVVYDLRPVACRTVFSPDAGCCQAMMEADSFDQLTPAQQAVATEISERSFRLQIAINDRRPVDGPMELRSLLLRLLDGGQ